MPYTKVIWVSVLFSLLTSFKAPVSTGSIGVTKRWVISENSSLRVNGSTNINTFSCEIPAYDQTDTLSLAKIKGDKGIVLSGDIALKIQSFDCHNSAMTKDLRKTLKEKQFPRLHIAFLSLSELPELSDKAIPIHGEVEIEIAGVKKLYKIDYRITIDGDKVIHLLGSRELTFSDFKLVPPRKLGGIIKTKDQLTVIFLLNMNTI